MKNTTFRKKALLSSVAMLLVALVALGSATFAWFTQNPTVTAEGLTLEATAGAGLQILSNTEKAFDDFSTTTTIDATAKDTTDPLGEVLDTPVSLDVADTSGTYFYTTTALIETDEAKDPNATISPSAADYSEVLYLRSSVDNGKAVNVVSAKVDFVLPDDEQNNGASKLRPAVRVTLVNNETKGVIGTWSMAGEGNRYITKTGESAYALTAEGVEYDAITGGTAVDVENFSVGYKEKANVSTADSVTMYVWLDGEDQACYTANVQPLKDLFKSIKVTFSTEDLS